MVESALLEQLAPTLPVETDPAVTRGLFITFEGGEGTGKSTHIRFLSEALRRKGQEVVCVREPGGTSIGEELRQVVLNPNNANMADECELLIYEAARAQIVQQTIRPALARGAVVLCDRFFDSTVAYQAFGRGLSRDLVQACNHIACQGLRPDRTILLVAPGGAEQGLERATRRFGADRLEMEGLDFHERVLAGFQRILAEEPDRMRKVVSCEERSQTARGVFEALADLFPWMDEALADQAFFSSLDRGW